MTERHKKHEQKSVTLGDVYITPTIQRRDVFWTLSNIYDGDFLAKILCGFWPLTIFVKTFIIDV